MSTPNPSAGWYPDPEKPGAQRYWDGKAWGQSAPDRPSYTPAPAGTGGAPATTTTVATPPRASMPIAYRLPILGWAGFALLLLIVGSIGPWITGETGFSSIDVNGTDRDGVVLIAIAVLIVPLLAVYTFVSQLLWLRIVCAAIALFLALIALLIAIVDFADVNDQANDILDISPGWGLWLCLFASVLLVFALISALAIRRFR